jgi:Uma2 family endonuclease
MGLPAPAPAAPPAVPPAEFRLKRFTVAEYERMVCDGTLDGVPVELLDGWIVEKMPHNAPHDNAIFRIQMRLIRLFGDDVLVRIQSSATLDTSVPEPDVSVVSGPVERYDRRRPRPRDLVMVVEVADTSLAQDQGYKVRLYAAGKVPVYWIVNLQDRRVEVYTNPRGGKNPTYRTRTDYGPGQDVPVVLAGKTVGTVAVNEILP